MIGSLNIAMCPNSSLSHRSSSKRNRSNLVRSRLTPRRSIISVLIYTLYKRLFNNAPQVWKSRNWFRGKICTRAPSITHMLFADDSYLYCKARESEAQRMLEILSKFELVSLQKINWSKFSVFFSTWQLDNGSVTYFKWMKQMINYIYGTAAHDAKKQSGNVRIFEGYIVKARTSGLYSIEILMDY